MCDLILNEEDKPADYIATSYWEYNFNLVNIEILVSPWTCSLSIMNVRTLESRCCLPAGYQRKTHKWKRAWEPRLLRKPAAAAAEVERCKQVRHPGRRLHGFYLSSYGERNIFQHLRGCGKLLLTHLISWFNARLNTPFYRSCMEWV